MNPVKLAPIFVQKLIISPMKRLFYILYTWCIFVPLFLVLTLLTALTTIVGCLLGYAVENISGEDNRIYSPPITKELSTYSLYMVF